MRREIGFALLALLAASLAAAQQAAPSTPPVAADQPVAITAYYAGPGVSAPELIPITLNDLFTGHCKKVDGTAVLSAVVDTGGTPRNVSYTVFIGNDLDRLAARWVAAERFKPGSHDGTPAAVVISDAITLNACMVEEKDQAGQNVHSLYLRSVPRQKIGLQRAPSGYATVTQTVRRSQPASVLAQPLNRESNPISAPVLLKSVPAQYSDQARKKKIQGVCLISLIVDAKGMPQNERVAYSLEPSLDQEALYAVSQYYFRPAMKDGKPVPVMITVEVEFKLY